MAAVAECVHATAVALGGFGVLIRGPSGAGKSDLALRCIAAAPSALIPQQAMLVADDQAALTVEDGHLIASAPSALRGMMEVRGLGIVPVPVCPRAVVVLVADLMTRHDVPRLPDPPPRTAVCGLDLPLVLIEPFEAAAPQKLLLALQQAASTRRNPREFSGRG